MQASVVNGGCTCGALKKQAAAAKPLITSLDPSAVAYTAHPNKWSAWQSQKPRLGWGSKDAYRPKHTYDAGRRTQTLQAKHTYDAGQRTLTMQANTPI